MKELSLLMLIIAILILSIMLLKNIFNKNPHRNYFFIPETSRLNIIWGMIFYLGYGFLTTHNFNLKIIFGSFVIIFLFYITYLYQIRRFFANRSSIITPALINHKISQQQNFDKTHPDYSTSQALKILGLHTSSIKSPEIILSKVESLNKIYQTKKIANPYFLEMIAKAKKTLLS